MIPHVTPSHQSLLSIYSFLPYTLKRSFYFFFFFFFLIEETVLVSNSVCIHWRDRCTVYSCVPAQECFSPGGSPGLDPGQHQKKHRKWINTEVDCRSRQVLHGKAISYACGGGVGRVLVKDHCGFCGNTWKLLKCRFFFPLNEPKNRLQGFVRATLSVFSVAVRRKRVWVHKLLRMTNETDVCSVWNNRFFFFLFFLNFILFLNFT